MSEKMHTWYGVVFKDGGGISSLWPDRELAEMEIQTFCAPSDVEVKPFEIKLSSEGVADKTA